ncbi:DUF4169 family protein [Pararhodospirillum photometricum]|uniref:Uncharacterized protein n=1 Tax=Pararhodospirillum photometricum DSM 122 TaxID=1150469 RepID=H6SKC5_PARPM|nr:DUF4169 family protein [Pararhodospirillum photometricum]CCG08440.1 Putative uncharacterized protein [Pararhodospirillum photometricum DSM 122]
MAEIINLRRARKAQARTAADREAEANRALFGRTKAERVQTTKERERDDRAFAGHRRDEPEEKG